MTMGCVECVIKVVKSVLEVIFVKLAMMGTTCHLILLLVIVCNAVQCVKLASISRRNAQLAMKVTNSQSLISA